MSTKNIIMNIVNFNIKLLTSVQSSGINKYDQRCFINSLVYSKQFIYFI